MPIGKDGIPLSYTVIGSATNVLDGTVRAELKFISKSPNYIAPQSLYATVTVSPMPITVEWRGTSLTYSGIPQSPVAISDRTEISVLGGMTDAGKYIAFAESLNVNYTVTNSECPFKIEKATNAWLTAPVVSDIFEGDAPSFTAESKYGTVNFAFYLDAALTEIISTPLTVGEYYAVAYVSESDNYLPLTSSPLKFSVIEVLPISLDVKMNKTRFSAFDKIEKSDYLLTVIYNNGEISELSHEIVDILYPHGESFRAGDNSVVFSCFGINVAVCVEVVRRGFNLSDITTGSSLWRYMPNAQTTGTTRETAIGNQGTFLS